MNPTSPWYFETFLARCWKEGNRCGRHLFHDVKQRGYTGSFSNLERLLGAWRRAEKEPVDGVPSMALSLGPVRDLRIPMKSAIDSETKPATYSDFIPATVPI